MEIWPHPRLQLNLKTFVSTFFLARLTNRTTENCTAILISDDDFDKMFKPQFTVFNGAKLDAQAGIASGRNFFNTIHLMENVFNWELFLDVSFYCEMDFYYFPFDTQNLSL